MPALEVLVRSFQLTRPPLVRTLDQVIPSSLNLGDAFVQWGKASRFQLLEPPLPVEPIVGPGWSINATFPPNPVPKTKPGEKPPDPQKPNNGITVLHWTELARSVQTVKVQNPDDAEQFILFNRVVSVLMQAPDGSYHQFDYKNDSGDT